MKTLTLLAVSFALLTSALAQYAFVPAGADWRYLADGSDQGTAWRAPTFNHSAWASGLAELGYGDGDEATVVPYGPDPNNKYITTYFRRGFWVTNAAQVTNLTLRLLVDDGAVVYINGVEVARYGMPAGPVTYQTLATIAAEGVWTDIPLSPSALVDFENSIAVEVHQANANSSDLSFNAALIGVLATSATPPTINQHPQSRTVLSGSSVSFFVSATGTQPLFYRWRKDGVPLATPTNSSGLIIQNVQTNHAGVYSVIVSNSAGAVLSSNATLTVIPSGRPIVNLISPTNGSVFPVGADIFLEATAIDSDGTVTLVEFFAGTNKIADGMPSIDSYTATWSSPPAGSYPLRAIATDDSNLTGSSQTILIHVGDPPVRPTIRQHPESQTVLPGSDVTFSVLADGTPPLRYRWRRNSLTLIGATNSTLTLFNVQSNHAGNYSVVVFNSAGSVLSSNAVLTVLPPPETNRPPAVAIVAPTNGTRFVEGEPILIEANAADSDGSIDHVEFSVGAMPLGEDSIPPYQFTWTNAPVGRHQLFATAYDNHGAGTLSAPVEVIVGNPVGNVVLMPRGGVWRYLDDGSDQGTFWKERIFTNEFAWSSGPAQLGFGDGDEATVLRSGSITYYFRKSLNISNASAFSNLELNMVRDDGAVVYINGTEVARQNMPTGPVNYQTFAAFVDPNENAFYSSPVPPGVLVDGFNTIAVEVHQVAFTSSDISFDFELRADSASPVPPTILSHPRSQTVSVGSNVTFRVEAGGSQPLRYQWRRNSLIIAGATNSTLTLFNVQTNAAGGYSVFVSNSAGSRLSATATLTVIHTNRPPTAHPQSVFALEDSLHPILLSGSDPDADPLTYSIAIPPAHGTLSGTGPDFLYTPNPNYNGSDQFTFRVSDGEFQSAPATVGMFIAPVNDAPVAIIRVPEAVNFLDALTVIILNETDPFLIDGTQSFDVDNDQLQYQWAFGNPPQSAARSSQIFSGLRPGTHLVHLTVSDGAESGTTSLILNVLTPCDAINLLIIEIDEAPLRRQTKRVLVQALRMACDAFDQGDVERGITRLEQFQHKVSIQLSDSNPAVAAVLIESTDILINALTQQ